MISRATLQPLRTISAACGLRTKRAIFGLFVNFCKNGYPQKWPKNQNFEKQKKVYRSLTLMISCAHLQPLRTISAAVGLRTKRAIFGPKSLKMPQKMTQKKYYKKTKIFFQKKKNAPSVQLVRTFCASFVRFHKPVRARRLTDSQTDRQPDRNEYKSTHPFYCGLASLALCFLSVMSSLRSL